MMVDELLNHLRKVRKNGAHSWMACCPAHDDKSPSLSLSEGSDGHILVHCFAGCTPQEVMTSLGLSLGDLFPKKDQHSFDDQPPKPLPKGTRLEEEIKNLEFKVAFYRKYFKTNKPLPGEREMVIGFYKRLQELKKVA